MSHADSHAKKRGNRLGFWFFKTAMRIVGLGGAYGLLYPVCLHYLLFDRAAFRVSDAYIKRRFKGYGFLRRMLGVYKLYISQGRTLIDRYYMAAVGPGEFSIDVKGYDEMKAILDDSKQGAILLTSHVGNWQITMTALGKLGKTVYLMMRPEDNAAVKEALNIDQEHESVKILNSMDFAGGVIDAMNALKSGSLVSIMGDRSYGHKTESAMFLGEKIYLPYSAFVIASAVKCPVFVLLSAKVSGRGYVLDVSRRIDTGNISRPNKMTGLRACVQDYARILEGYVERHPYQWFVFCDIWDEQKASQS